MPIYEFQCNTCEYVTDVILPMSEIGNQNQSEETIEKTTCKTCNERLIKLISLPAFLGPQDYRKMTPSQQAEFNKKMKRRSSEHFKKEGGEELKKEKLKENS